MMLTYTRNVLIILKELNLGVSFGFIAYKIQVFSNLFIFRFYILEMA